SVARCAQAGKSAGVFFFFFISNSCETGSGRMTMQVSKHTPQSHSLDSLSAYTLQSHTLYPRTLHNHTLLTLYPRTLHNHTVCIPVHSIITHSLSTYTPLVEVTKEQLCSPRTCPAQTDSSPPQSPAQ